MMTYEQIRANFKGEWGEEFGVQYGGWGFGMRLRDDFIEHGWQHLKRVVARTHPDNTIDLWMSLERLSHLEQFYNHYLVAGNFYYYLAGSANKFDATVEWNRVKHKVSADAWVKFHPDGAITQLTAAPVRTVDHEKQLEYKRRLRKLRIGFATRLKMGVLDQTVTLLNRDWGIRGSAAWVTMDPEQNETYVELLKHLRSTGRWAYDRNGLNAADEWLNKFDLLKNGCRKEIHERFGVVAYN